MLKPRFRFRPEQLSGNRQGVGAKLRVAQFRRKLDGIEKLRQFRRTSVIGPRQIELGSLFPTRTLLEKTIEGDPQLLDLRGRRNGIQSQKSVLAKAGDLIGC